MKSPAHPSTAKFILSAKVKGVATALILVAVAAFLMTVSANPQRVWANILLNNYYFLCLAVGGAFFVALQYLASAGWATALRRIPEAMTAYLPIAAVIMIIFYIFAVHSDQSLYHWVHAHGDALLAKKGAYLNTTAFLLRMLVFFAIWIGFSIALRRNSVRQDSDGDVVHNARNIKVSAIFIPLFALTVSFASFDWLMSLEPHWFSTIFGVYNFAGLFQSSIVVITLIVLALMRKGPLQGLVTENHLHDLGKLIFAFSTFWAYIWLSQYLLIWYANIPEESVYYVVRNTDYYFPLFLLNVGINWAFPFLALMQRSSKRNPKILLGVCLVLLFGRWLDLYLMISPSINHEHTVVPIGIFELIMTLGFAGLFIFAVGFVLARTRLLPIRDPYLDESLHHHQ